LTVRDIAAKLAKVVGKENIQPEIVGKYRVGDIRHCFADISKASACSASRRRCGWTTAWSNCRSWLASQAAVDRVAQASAELSARGLTV
jgi:dTDP-L-rhamnose 4-epimerase